MIRDLQSERTQNTPPCAGCFNKEPHDDTWWEDMDRDAQQYLADQAVESEDNK